MANPTARKSCPPPESARPAATDKAFWGDTAAPDYAGRTKSFRGEDVRLVLNSTGFQLTFNRPVNNLSTTYPGVVPLFNDSSTPYAEHLPVVLQGMWSEVETALVNALPVGNWRVALTNSAIASGQSAGNAVIDELRVVGSTGPQAAPPLAVTAPANTTRALSWTRIHGAMSYAIERSSSPDGPFTPLVTLPNTAATHNDTVPQNIAYYYRIAAIGSDGGTGTWSVIAFAARNVAPPSTPSSVSVAFPASSQANLSWSDNANNETAYRIERSPAGLEQWALLTGSLAAGSTAYTDASVIAGNSYDYRISAVGSGGISGYTTITANVPITALEAWRQTYFNTTSNTGDAADNADPDFDGNVNLVEYALGTLPNSAASSVSPVVGTMGDRLALTFNRVRGDLTYIVEAGSTLAAWSTLATNPGSVGASVTVTDTVEISNSDPPARFLRLRVIAP
jgi:hypothetical protein